VTAFADQISKDPMLFSALQILHGDCCEFGAAQPASQKHGDNRIVAFVPKCLEIERRE
jgi:hypothetical protein